MGATEISTQRCVPHILNSLTSHSQQSSSYVSSTSCSQVLLFPSYLCPAVLTFLGILVYFSFHGEISRPICPQTYLTKFNNTRFPGPPPEILKAAIISRLGPTWTTVFIKCSLVIFFFGVSSSVIKKTLTGRWGERERESFSHPLLGSS